MKNRLLTDAFREVRHTLSRFLSLFLLSALAVAFLAGLRTTAPDMEFTADAYYDEHQLMDLHILSTLGLTDGDISVLSEQEGVDRAEGAYTVDAILHRPDNDLILKLHSLSKQDINLPQLREGRLPTAPDECLTEPAFMKALGLEVGDTITLDTGDGNFADALRYDTFTIVGVADSPLYISVQRGSSSLGTGKVTAFALLPEEAFDLDFYTDAYVMAEGADDLLCYGDDYEAQIDALTDRLEPLSDQRADHRYQEIMDEANDKLADAQEEYDEAEEEVRQQLTDAKRELEEARADLDDGWQQYHDGVEELQQQKQDAEAQIADAEAQLPGAFRDLVSGEQQYAEGSAQLELGQQQYEAGQDQLADGLAQYQDGYQQIMDGENAYNENLETLQQAERDYNEGMAAYRDGLQDLADGGQQLMDACAGLERALKTLQRAEDDLEAGKEMLTEQEQQLAQLQQGYRILNFVLHFYHIDDPEVFSWELSLMNLDPTGTLPRLFHKVIVAPLYAMMDGFDGMLPAEMQSRLDAILPLLPADGDSFAESLKDPATRLDTAKSIAEALHLAEDAIPVMEKLLEEGREALEDGEEQLSDGWRQYHAGKRQYLEAKAEFDQGADEAIAGGQQLSDAHDQLDSGWGQLRGGRLELDEAWTGLAEAQDQLRQAEADLKDAWSQLVSGKADMADARASLDDGWAQYQSGIMELAEAKAQLPIKLDEAQETLDEAYADLLDGEKQYEDGLQEYLDGKEEAEEELSDARRQLNDAKRDIADIEDCEWYVLDRGTNIGYVSFQQDAERMGNLADVFPLIFFLVAALVCLTTMTRMVEEQRVQIGSIKALGYSKGAIALKYVGYGFAASLLGGLVGLAVGTTLIPWIIFNAWKILYTVGELKIPFSPGISLLALGAAVACVTGAAIGASFSTLTAVPATLMRPRTPPAGKRVLLEYITPLWSRLSFIYKVTLRNLFRYQKRFWMTVIGIGGCTALIVSAFGLRSSIFDVLDRQYDDISVYSSNIGLADNVTEDELTEIGKALEDTGLVESYIPSYQISLSVEGPKQTVDATLFAVDDPEAFEDFVCLRHRKDQSPIPFPEEGAIITEKLSNLLGVKQGDTITLDGDRRVEVPVVDITENYILHFVYLSDDYYTQLFGKEPPVNMMLAKYTDDTVATSDKVSSQVVPLAGVTSISRILDNRDTFTKSIESVDYAVILIIVCAAALAFVVLYNLTNINITERLRELATLKVLGFYDRELSAYVYRENVFLTGFGILLGLLMGKFLHGWLVRTVEIDMLMFGRTVAPSSFLFAILLTALFSLLVNLAAHRRLKQIDMVESLKTVE